MRQTRFVNKAKARPQKGHCTKLLYTALHVVYSYAPMWKIETYSCGNFKYTVGCSITIVKYNEA